MSGAQNKRQAWPVNTCSFEMKLANSLRYNCYQELVLVNCISYLIKIVKKSDYTIKYEFNFDLESKIEEANYDSHREATD